MCVVIAPAVMYGIAAATAALGAYSSYSSSKQAQYQYDYEAKVAANNAVMAGYAAEDAQRQGERQIEQSNQRARALRGAQEVALAGNGLMLDSGSALSLLEDTDLFMSQDAATIRTNAARDAWGYQTQGMNYTSQAGMLKTAAGNQNPGLNAGISLLGSAAQAYGSGLFSTGGAGGVNLQGQPKALTNNTAFVKNM